uniref:Unconventional myosin-XV-like domain-containing protein n=1 Tax=Timema shepardi TaxID=629360 RepID=A0A7R9G202_TIMSH|nr:unnamed protein product [Timema shepardi]
MEKVSDSQNDVSMILMNAVSNKEYMTKAEALLEENLESVSQRGDSRKYSLNNSRATDMNGRSNSSVMLDNLPSDLLTRGGSRQDLTLDFEYPDILSSQTRSEDDKGSYIKGHPRQYAGKKAAPGSHSSRAYIETRNSEKSEYGTKSSALSDTSEAPSLASHVRRVRVPSQASDVDQFLDDLFMPVLDGNLDELSDARSLAASLKGGGDKRRKLSDSSVLSADYEVAILTGSAASSIRWPNDRSSAENVDDYITDLFKPIFVNDSLKRLTAASALAGAIKGGGGMEAQQTTSRTQATAFSFTPIANMTSPTPVMMSGMMSPPPMMMPTLPLYSQAAQRTLGKKKLPSTITPEPALREQQCSLNLVGPPFFPIPSYIVVSLCFYLLACLFLNPCLCVCFLGVGPKTAQTTAGLSFMGSGGAATMPPFFPGGAPVMPDLTGHSLPQTTAGAQGFMPVPIYNMQEAGMSLPPYSPLQQPSGPAQQPNVDPSLAAYQQSIQRVFLQSAMAQNMQIQQQLLAQNQALQHMLHQQAQPPGLHVMSMSGVPPQMAGLQPAYDSLGRNSKVSFREPENTELWSTEKRQTTPVMPQQQQQLQQQQPHPVSSQSPAPPLPPKSRFNSPPQQAQQLYKQETTVKAQVHRSQSPNREFIVSSRKLTPTKSTSHTAFTSVLSELKSRKSSTESSYSFSHKVSSPGVPPPPPPPMPPPPDHGDPSEARPFLDPYGRAKTVRIGKWRWPPPKMENEDSSDSFLQFKLRQHHRKTTPQQQQYNPTHVSRDRINFGECPGNFSHGGTEDVPATRAAVEREQFPRWDGRAVERVVGAPCASVEERYKGRLNSEAQQPSSEFGEHLEGIEWEEFELSESTAPTKEPANRKESRPSRKELQLEGKDKNAIKSFEVGVSRPSPASIGKLRISSEMRSKLEMVTANHSVRATNKPEKPGVLPIKKDESPQRPVKKLEDNRKLLLEQQLWDTVDSVEMVNSAVSKEERSDVQQTNIVRSQVERMEKTTPVSPRFEEKAVSGWDKGSSPISNGWDKGSPPISGVPSSHWDKVISTNAQWDKGGTPVPQWDKGGTPVPQWDKFGLPGTQWDKIGSPGTQWDKVGAPTSQWDKIEAPSSQWDKAGPPSSQWDKAGPPTSQWDKVGAPTSQWDKVGGSPGNNWDAGWGEKSTNNSWRPAPPPPPVTPHFIDTSPASRTSSFYSQNNQPTPRSPPPPIQPIKSNRDQYQHHNNINHHSDLFHNTRNEVFSREAFTNQARRIDNDRRSSVSTHLTDRMERIEIEESSEFLKPVDSAPPMVMERRDVDRSVEAIKTKLFGASSAAFFTYNRVSWRLIVRKEVFAPGESLASPLALHLVFCQVVQDVLSGPCVRINREHRAKMKKLLDSYGVTLNNVHSAQQKTTIKKNVVDLAKDWPTYFSRIFAVSGGHQHPAVQLLAVSHSGVRLLRREATPVDETLQVLDTFSFEEIAETSVPKGSAVQIMLTSGGRVLLYTHRANQVHTMIDKYTIDSEKLSVMKQSHNASETWTYENFPLGGDPTKRLG